MVLPSRLGCPLSLKTPNMGNPGSNVRRLSVLVIVAVVAVLCAAAYLWL